MHYSRQHPGRTEPEWIKALKPRTFTFRTWRQEHPTIGFEPLESGAYIVYSQHPDLWAMSDYKVSSVISGRAVLIVPFNP